MKKLSATFLFVTAVGFLSVTFSLVRAQQRGEKPIEEQKDRPEARAALSVSVDQIQVDVTVQDRKKNLIQGLQKEHFKIYEDKVEQKIANFGPVEAPMTAIMVTEYSKAIPWEWLYESWMASHVFVEQIRKDDWVAVVAYDVRPEILVDFTQNQNEVYNALRRLNFPAYRESSMYDAVYDVLDRVEEVEGKVAIVLISSGLDTLSKKNLGETLDRVKQSNVVIYPVSLGGNFRARYDHYIGDMARMDLHRADATLKQFAKYTGGQAFFPRFTQAYRQVFSTISALVRNQYSLSYVSTNPKKDGKYRKIKVEVVADIDGDGKPDKVRVNHREGYQVDDKG